MKRRFHFTAADRRDLESWDWHQHEERSRPASDRRQRERRPRNAPIEVPVLDLSADPLTAEERAQYAEAARRENRPLRAAVIAAGLLTPKAAYAEQADAA
jgi:hypothetical protein